VPYLTQTEQLCGGAAVAMVLRYWGDRDTVAQDFSPLVEPAAGGIRTTRLAAAVRDRGWQIRVLTGGSSEDTVRAELMAAHPVIALIEDRPRIYHYVVVAGVTPQDVVIHDPARWPYRVMARAEFDRRSAAAGHWLMVILPGATGPADHAGVLATSPAADAHPPDAALEPTTPCTALVAASVSAAGTGDLTAAERGLLSAVLRCPDDGSGWRELAGLRFVQKRYADASDLARRAAVLDRDDGEAWRLLGSALYLRDNLTGALEAWNHVGEPHVDVINVEGLTRTRYPVAVGITGLESRQILTPGAFRLAARRLGELPSAAATGLRYRPLDGGKAAVDVTVVERSVLPRGWLGWGTLGITSGFRREIRLDVSSPARDGDVWVGAYRWAHNRPRVTFGLSVPPRHGLPAVLDMDAFWERQSYATAAIGADPLVEERRRGAVHLSNWATDWLYWRAGGAVDRIADRHYVAADARIVAHWAGDRLAAIGGAARWLPTSGGPAFSTLEVSGAWRTTTQPMTRVFSARAGLQVATADAPLAVWPMAGSSDSRGVLLRGHTLFDDGVITSPAVGRRLIFGTAEYAHPIYVSAYGSMAVAGFVDAARASRRLGQLTDTPLHVDVGTGLRIATPAIGGQIRLDVGLGVRDHAAKLSAGYVLPWGR
jgi:hypothetical protein